jgi:hypothetical protein
MQVSFAMNGESMGVAFNEILTFEPHLAYFPAVSLSQGELCSVNLGALPFVHPQEGFRPMARPAALHAVAQSDRLLACIERLALVRCSRGAADRSYAPAPAGHARRCVDCKCEYSPSLSVTHALRMQMAFAAHCRPDFLYPAG